MTVIIFISVEIWQAKELHSTAVKFEHRCGATSVHLFSILDAEHGFTLLFKAYFDLKLCILKNSLTFCVHLFLNQNDIHVQDSA